MEKSFLFFHQVEGKVSVGRKAQSRINNSPEVMTKHCPLSLPNGEALRESLSESEKKPCFELSADFDVIIAVNHRPVEGGEQNGSVVPARNRKVKGVRRVDEGDGRGREWKAEVLIGVRWERVPLWDLEAWSIGVGDFEGEVFVGEDAKGEIEATHDGTRGL
jgi:hypothetical protein